MPYAQVRFGCGKRCDANGNLLLDFFFFFFGSVSDMIWD